MQQRGQRGDVVTTPGWRMQADLNLSLPPGKPASEQSRLFSQPPRMHPLPKDKYLSPSQRGESPRPRAKASALLGRFPQLMKALAAECATSHHRGLQADLWGDRPGRDTTSVATGSAWEEGILHLLSYWSPQEQRGHPWGEC